ncbi:MAG: hypothetical protein QF918_15290, partial [Pirellulaceae bacterium]|nr:hypothetical protein [Pirellulaceae bacterium]
MSDGACSGAKGAGNGSPCGGAAGLPCCTIPIEAECSFGLDSHHPIISLQGIPSSVIVFRILHP